MFERVEAWAQLHGCRQLKIETQNTNPRYAPRFFVAGPKGSMTFANDTRFLEWLAQVRAFNREHGMRALSPAAVRETALSPLHVLAQVRWSARFEKTGARAVEFEIAYLME